jgi:acetyl esterase/lipase
MSGRYAHLRVALGILAATIVMQTADGQTELMTTADYNRLGGPAPDFVERYGEAPEQYGQLRLPATASPGLPVPVIVVIHGGCWLEEYDLTGTEPLSHALTGLGVATWNIEYRRIGSDGGGWPGTFEDVAAAADHLRILAGRYPLDLDRVVTLGHSAGGHLALWLAARGDLPGGSPGSSDPLPVHGVVALAAVSDLVSGAENEVCGNAIPNLLGGMPAAEPERYARTSPRQLLPLGLPQVLIHGAGDQYVPPGQSRDYASAARDAGEDAELLLVENAGHFEIVAPTTTAWRSVERAVEELVASLRSR